MAAPRKAMALKESLKDHDQVVELSGQLRVLEEKAKDLKDIKSIQSTFQQLDKCYADLKKLAKPACVLIKQNKPEDYPNNDGAEDPEGYIHSSRYMAGNILYSLGLAHAQRYSFLGELPKKYKMEFFRQLGITKIKMTTALTEAESLLTASKAYYSQRADRVSIDNAINSLSEINKDCNLDEVLVSPPAAAASSSAAKKNARPCSLPQPPKPLPTGTLVSRTATKPAARLVGNPGKKETIFLTSAALQLAAGAAQVVNTAVGGSTCEVLNSLKRTRCTGGGSLLATASVRPRAMAVPNLDEKLPPAKRAKAAQQVASTAESQAVVDAASVAAAGNKMPSGGDIMSAHMRDALLKEFTDDAKEDVAGLSVRKQP